MRSSTITYGCNGQVSTYFSPGGKNQKPKCLCLPCVLPRCCAGSSLSERLDDSLWRLRTPWTPALQTQHPHCSRPTSSLPRGVPCGGNHSRTWWMCPQHRSASLQTPRLLKLWRGQTPTLGSLRDGRRQTGRDSVSNMDTAVFTTTSIQTDVMKGIPRGNNLLTQHFIFEKGTFMYQNLRL